MINGDDEQDDGPGALIRIAQALEVPVATFMTAHPAGTPDTEILGADPPLTEVVALLRLFVRLKSPEARARCLAYMVQEVTHDD